MTYLSLDEIEQATKLSGPPFRMVVYHSHIWWAEIKNHNLPKPIKLKFGPDIIKNMQDSLKKSKGIYMFFVEPCYRLHSDVNNKHLLYIGRVRAMTTNYNFQKRFYEYVSCIGDKNAKRNRLRLTNLYPQNTFVYFFQLNHKSDQEIKDIESNLIDKILPPLNEELSAEASQTRKLY